MTPPHSVGLSPVPLSIETIRNASGSPAQAREVARHFEAMLIQEVVKAARGASGGWLGDDAEQSSEAMAQMGEEFLTSAIASGGGFGLADSFVKSLESTLAPTNQVTTLGKISDRS